MDRPTVAVVGAGVAGLTAAYVLQRQCDVTLYEAAAPARWPRAHPRGPVGRRPRAPDRQRLHRLQRPAPTRNLLRLFGELGVETQPTEMSMSVRCDGCGLEYAGARGLGGVFADARRGASPAFLRMLVEVKRFHRRAARACSTAAATTR